MERQSKQATVELANTFLDEVLDCTVTLEDKNPEDKFDFILKNAVIKFPELKDVAAKLYNEHIKQIFQQK